MNARPSGVRALLLLLVHNKCKMMTVEITLPDQLVEDAQRAGLLSSEALEQLLRHRLQERNLDEIFAAMRSMDAVNDPEILTPEVAAAEIAAMRSERRAESNS